MPAYSLTTAQAKLQEYLTAETAVLGGQETRVGDRLLRRADLEAIREGITYWSRQVEALEAGGRGPRVYGLTPGG